MFTLCYYAAIMLQFKFYYTIIMLLLILKVYYVAIIRMVGNISDMIILII